MISPELAPMLAAVISEGEETKPDRSKMPDKSSGCNILLAWPLRKAVGAVQFVVSVSKELLSDPYESEKYQRFEG